jgi:hypothetical protein
MDADSLGLSLRAEGNIFFDAGDAVLAVDMQGETPPLALHVACNNFDPSKGSNRGCALRIGETCYTRGREIDAAGLGVGNLDVPSGFAGPREYRLAAHSRLIDAGKNPPPPICPCTCPGPFCNVELDLDGHQRPADGDGDGVPVNDIGAFEYVP